MLAASPAQSDSTNGDLILLSVIKDTLSAELTTLTVPTQHPRLLKKFQIALGKEDGDKQVEGDNKTPEGIYFTQNHIDGKALPAKYGTYAIPINFPNPVDKIAGKTGYGIWLHGVETAQRIEKAKVTEGCVAFYNQDIDALSSWLKPFQGVVAITKDKSALNRKEDMDLLMQLTQQWAEAWALRDHDAYISFYHHKFHNHGRDKEGYRQYKKRVFNGYKKMDVRISDIRVVTHPKYAVSLMNQDFNGDSRFISKGRKILYWLKNELGQYKIVNEDFQNMRFETMADKTIDTLVSSESAAIKTHDQEKNQKSI